jgi:hypothetical protein
MDNENMKIIEAYFFARTEAGRNNNNMFLADFFKTLADIAEKHLNDLGIDPEKAMNDFYGEDE